MCLHDARDRFGNIRNDPPLLPGQRSLALRVAMRNRGAAQRSVRLCDVDYAELRKIRNDQTSERCDRLLEIE